MRLDKTSGRANVAGDKRSWPELKSRRRIGHGAPGRRTGNWASPIAPQANIPLRSNITLSRASSAQPLTASRRCVSVFSRLDGSSSRRLGIVGGRWYRERRVCIYRLRTASDMRRLRHIKALLRSFVPGGGADGAQDAQECRGHVVHLTLNHVKSPADPY